MTGGTEETLQELNKLLTGRKWSRGCAQGAGMITAIALTETDWEHSKLKTAEN
jgi:hypothetical protein